MIKLNRVKNDNKNNIVFVVHFRELLQKSGCVDFWEDYALAKKKAALIGGSVYMGTDHIGGMSFVADNTQELRQRITEERYRTRPT
jgi:hypothetical protein